MNADKNREERRAFLMKCGKFAVVTPPAVALMLSAAKGNYALAVSGGSHPNNGFGNGGGDGVPGNSGNNNSPNADQKKKDKVR